MDQFKDYLGEALNKIAHHRFQDALLINLEENSFSFLHCDPPSYETTVSPSKTKFSKWATDFAFSKRCHPEDREKVVSFLDIPSIIKFSEMNDGAPKNCYFRGTTQLNDSVFTPTSMTLVPIIKCEKPIYAFLFIMDLSKSEKEWSSVFSNNNSSHFKTNARGRRSILVLEDKEKDIEELKTLLGSVYDLIFVPNELEALNVLQEDFHRFSLVLLSLHLQNLGGQKFISAIRNDPFLTNIPLVVMLDSSNLQDKLDVIHLGATDYISKPYHPEIIRFHIHNLIHRNETPTSLASAEYDEETGVYSRAAFHFFAKKVLEENPKKNYSIVVIDIANFESVVTLSSFEIGKSIMKVLATSLLNPPKGIEMLVGRLDTSKFVGLLYSEEALTEEKRLSCFNLVKTTFPDFHFDFKIAVFEDVDHTASVSVLCDRALVALESIRNKYGVSLAIFDLKSKIAYEKRLFIENSMISALQNKEFEVYYQPKHDAKTGKLVGAEALLRWNHPEMGFIPTLEFIPVLESTGFIAKVDTYVWSKTCENLRKWQDEGLRIVPVSINATRMDFDEESFRKSIHKPIEEYRLSKDLLHLEVTESMFIDNLEEYNHILRNYQREGFKIELDDFGSGYSSLVELGTLPLDYVKLDISLIRRCQDERTAKTIFSIVQLCKKLGLKTIAEGIETKEQFKTLKRMGVNLIQGYYFSKPLSEKDFKDYLKKHK